MGNKIIIAAVAALLMAAALPAAGQNVGIATNLADYVSYGTLNISASMASSPHWTLEAQAKYNPFTFGAPGEEDFSRRRQFSAGSRYWPWHVFSGWWLSGSLRYQEFSRTADGSPVTTEGDRFGGSIGAGYSYMLGKHFNLDLGMGVWGGYQLYTDYSCAVCGDVLSRGAKYFFLPDEFVVALSYIF